MKGKSALALKLEKAKKEKAERDAIEADKKAAEVKNIIIHSYQFIH